MPRKLSTRQTAALTAFENLFATTRAPVAYEELRKALPAEADRWLTGTVASLIERDLLFVPVRGVAAYLPASRFVPALAALLKLDPTHADVEKHLRARLYGMGVRDTCSRCGGCGRYSFNMMDGDRCFGCNGRGHTFVPHASSKTFMRAQTAVESGQLDVYLAHLGAVRKARKAIRPLLADVSNLSKLVHARDHKAFGEWGSTLRNDEIGMSVRSLSHRLVIQANALSTRAHEVESAVRGGQLDAEVGVLFAFEILRECVSELLALYGLALAKSVDELRAQVHPDFACKFCKRTLSVYGSHDSGQVVLCFHPWVRDGSVGCGFKNTVP